MIDVLWLGETDEQVIEVMRRQAPPEVRLTIPSDGAPTAEDLRHSRYIVNGGRRIDARTIEAAPHLRLIQRLGAGLDGIDLEATERAGVEVANLPARNSVAVAEMTLTLAMACARDLVRLDSSMKEGRWRPNDRLSSTFELQGSTWGVIGLGNIGRAVASRAAALGMEILYYDAVRPGPDLEGGATFAPLEELLAQSRIVSVHLPLTAGTTGLLGASQLAMMPERSVLISISRAGVVEGEALRQALESGHLAAAAVDVWDREPVPTDDPLLHAPHLIATPHSGAQTHDTVARVFADAFAAVLEHARTRHSASAG